LREPIGYFGKEFFNCKSAKDRILGVQKMMIKTNCKFYRGDKPCLFHKEKKVVCETCSHYVKLGKRLLIIKLGSLGDVIRTTPLLRKLKDVFPEAEISWLTQYQEALSSEYVDNILEVNLENITWLTANSFDWLINLDKAKLAISLSKLVKAKKKSGFGMDKYGKCAPVERKGQNKWLTGIDDTLGKANDKNYLEEIFQISGFRFNREEYIIPRSNLQVKHNWDINNAGKVIGLNTGSGPLWKSRRWPQRYWIELAKKLRNAGCEVILLGGELEDFSNRIIASESGAKYFGNFNLSEFTELVDRCDLIVTGVTMCLHLAIGLKKKVVALNSAFNKNEFYLYERGVILEPEIECGCYYAEECPRQCMNFLTVEKVNETVWLLLNK